MDDNKPCKSWDNMCDVLVMSIYLLLERGWRKVMDSRVMFERLCAVHPLL